MTDLAVPQSPSPPSGAPRVTAHVFALSDVGRVREHNEDAFLVADLETGRALTFADGPVQLPVGSHGLLFLVADGMGGAASGEIASAMAGTNILASLQAEWQHETEPSPERFAAALRDATMLANHVIHQYAQEHLEHRGMGTTATVAGLLGSTLYIAQVGDSRAYLLRDDQPTQLTKDQSLMQRLVDAGEMTPAQAEASEHRNIILQALGPEALVSVDLTHQPVRAGDLLVLCSDGLSGLVRADEMGQLAAYAQDVDTVCELLVNRANTLGGPDNITVIAVRFDGADPATVDDGVAYRTYPLAGTMYHHSGANDVTPAVGTPSIAPLPPAAPVDASPIGAPPEVVAVRQAQARPLLWMLAVAALALVAWLVLRVGRS